MIIMTTQVLGGIFPDKNPMPVEAYQDPAKRIAQIVTNGRAGLANEAWDNRITV